MAKNYAEFIIRHKIITVILSVMMVMAMGFGAQFLTFTNDYRVFFGEDNPQLMAFCFAIYEKWHQSIADVMSQAKESGQIIDEADPYTLAVTIAATMEGAINAAKVAQDLDKLYYCGCGLIQYLQLIRKQQ